VLVFSVDELNAAERAFAASGSGGGSVCPPPSVSRQSSPQPTPQAILEFEKK